MAPGGGDEEHDEEECGDVIPVPAHDGEHHGELDPAPDEQHLPG